MKCYINAPRNVAWNRKGVLKRDKYGCTYSGVKLCCSYCTIDHLCLVRRGHKSTWYDAAWASAARSGRKVDGDRIRRAGGCC